MNKRLFILLVLLLNQQPSLRDGKTESSQEIEAGPVLVNIDVEQYAIVDISVSPDLAYAIVGANYGDAQSLKVA